MRQVCLSSSGNKDQVTVVVKYILHATYGDFGLKDTAPLSHNWWVCKNYIWLILVRIEDQQLFHLWFKNHFLKYISACRLLMDGHKSHYNPETIRLAATVEIILFTLPQPLDRSCFGSLKTAWRLPCHRFTSCDVIKHSFLPLFHDGFSTRNNIMSAFRVTGIYLIHLLSCLMLTQKPTGCLRSQGYHINPTLVS